MDSGRHRGTSYTDCLSIPVREDGTLPARTVGVQGNMKGQGTVATQHQRYFRKKGNFNCPRKVFGKQLITQLKAWRAAGDNIILFVDLNENIYTCLLARQL